jgi:hypothetical protein
VPLTQAMRDLFAKFTTTEDSTSERFGSTGAYIRVGSSTAAFNSNQNELQTTSTGSTGANQWIRAMDAGFPKRNDGSISTGPNILAYRATFTTSEANHDWNEIGVKNTTATSTGTGALMQRLLATDMGTKLNTQSWQVTLLNTVST